MSGSRCAWFNLHGFGLYRTSRNPGPATTAALEKSQNLSQRGAKPKHQKTGKKVRSGL
jgi:hypothetical protein